MKISDLSISKKMSLILPWTLLLMACSSSPKKLFNQPILSELQGKKIALVSIEGEPTAQKIIEVALVNQLIQRGSFILVAKPEIEAARSAPEQNPLDWKGIAKKVGADYALQIQVLQFNSSIHSGYSSREMIDTQLADEQGTDGKTDQVFQVKTLEGQVRFSLNFTNLINNDFRIALAQAQNKVLQSAETSSIHLPPKLRFLEDLSNQAFKQFFDADS